MLNAAPVAIVTAYSCRSADNHVYAVMRQALDRYTLLVRKAHNPASTDKSDIIYDGHDITSIETNGGQAKMIEVEKIFRLIVRQKRYRLPERALKDFVGAIPKDKCRFRYTYNLSP